MSVKGFFGGLLMTIGIIGAVLTGGCTLLFSIEFMKGGNNEYINFVVIAAFGLIPFIICLGIAFLGRFLFKRR